MVQELTHTLWNQWSEEYVTQMFERLRWKHPVENLKVDDVVIVKYENRLKKERDYLRWPMARVTQTFPGPDGLVRSVEVETIEGTVLIRPINRLCKLPINAEFDKIDIVEECNQQKIEEIIEPPVERAKLTN